MPTPYSRYYTYIKPIVDNQVVKSYSAYIFSLITVAILIIFAVRPTVSTILNLQKELQNQKSALQSLKNKSNNLTEAKRNLEALPDDTKAKIQRALPIQANVTSLIKALQGLSLTDASSSAIQIQPVTIFNISDPKAKLDVGQISFVFNAEVDYPQALKTLAQINKLSRAVSVDTLTLTKQQGGLIIISVNGKAYFVK